MGITSFQAQGCKIRRMIALLLIGLVIAAAFGWLLLAGATKIGRDQDRAEKNADQILNEAFDGRPDVTFTLNMRTLKPETVVLGAKARGYKLVHETQGQYGPTGMIFEKF